MKIVFGIILLIIVVSHFLFLNSSPSGMSHDEVIYSLSRETILHGGTDISGSRLPLAFFKTDTEGKISILPVILLAPIHIFLPLNQVTARLPYVIISFLTAVGLFLFSYFLLKNKVISLLTALLFLVNPWAFFLSRFATESPFALLFFIYGMALLLILRGWLLLIPWILFMLGFYSYHGAKIIFLPIIILMISYLVWNKKMNLSLKQGNLFILGSVLVIMSFIFICSLIPGSILSSRNSEMIFNDSQNTAKTVNAERATTINSRLVSLFINKQTVTINEFMESYLNAFSPNVLFLHGDSRIIYSFIDHGLFYVFDLLLIPLGIYYLWKQRRKELLLLFGLVLLSPLASAVSTVDFSYVHRAFLLLPLLIIFSGTGLYMLYGYGVRILNKYIVGGILTFIVLVSFTNFFYFYNFRYPVTMGEFYSLNERLLAKYIKEESKGNKSIYIFSNSAGDEYYETIFYNNSIANYKALIHNVSDFTNGVYTINNVHFTKSCPKAGKDSIIILQNIKQCSYLGMTPNIIVNPKDSGAFYRVYNSSLCPKSILSPYKRLNLRQDYNIENLDKNTFCQRWIAYE